MSAIHSVLDLTLLWATENAFIYIYIYSRSESVSTCIVCVMLDGNGCSTQRRGVPWHSVGCWLKKCLSSVCSGGTTAWHFVEVPLHDTSWYVYIYVIYVYIYMYCWCYCSVAVHVPACSIDCAECVITRAMWWYDVGYVLYTVLQCCCMGMSGRQAVARACCVNSGCVTS